MVIRREEKEQGSGGGRRLFLIQPWPAAEGWMPQEGQPLKRHDGGWSHAAEQSFRTKAKKCVGSAGSKLIADVLQNGPDGDRAVSAKRPNLDARG